MKTLFRAKLFDQNIQLAALIIPFIWAVGIKDGWTMLYAYFSVGFVQVVSCLANKRGLDDRLKSRSRRRYERWLLVVFIISATLSLLCFGDTDAGALGLVIFGFLMLFVSVGMAIWYFVITAGELKRIRRLYHIHNGLWKSFFL